MRPGERFCGNVHRKTRAFKYYIWACRGRTWLPKTRQARKCTPKRGNFAAPALQQALSDTGAEAESDSVPCATAVIQHAHTMRHTSHHTPSHNKTPHHEVGATPYRTYGDRMSNNALSCCITPDHSSPQDRPVYCTVSLHEATNYTNSQATPDDGSSDVIHMRNPRGTLPTTRRPRSMTDMSALASALFCPNTPRRWACGYVQNN